jgi:DNA polymerase III subunit delta
MQAMIECFTGENSFELHDALNKHLSAFVKKYGEMSIERYDGEEAGFEQIQEALQSLPFLVKRKLIVLRSPGANRKFVENAERLIKDLPETTDLIILEPKFDKRSTYYKLLKKITVFREFIVLDRSGLAKWLVAKAKEQNGSLSLSDALYLIDRVGGNQQGLSNELDKLLLYSPNISRNSIEDLTEANPQSSIFELLEAAFTGNQKRILMLYDEQRNMKVEPQQIVAMLAWQFHVMAVIKSAADRTLQQISNDANLNPFVVRKSSTIARKFEVQQLKLFTAELLRIDIRLKTESIDPDEAIKNYLMSLRGNTGQNN